MKKHKITKTNNDYRVLSLRRLPSGFGSVRYLGKGRCSPYAVHPPESPAEPFQSGNRRPPALCYVHNRETGIKILIIYHAGLYEPGLENNLIRLNQLYKKVLDQGEGTKAGSDVNISWEKASRYTMYEGSPVNINTLTPQNTDTEDLAEYRVATTESRGKLPSDPSDVPSDDGCPPAVKPEIPPDKRTDKPLVVKPDISSITEPTSMNAGIDVSHAGDAGISSAPGQSESVEALYRRLNSLQDTIRNLMQDIERMKTQYGGGMDGKHIVGLVGQRISSQPATQLISPQSDSWPMLPQYSGSPILPQPVGLPISPHAEAPLYSDRALTLSAVYEAFHQFKYGPQAAKQLSMSSRNATAAAYRKLSCFYDFSLDEIGVMEWQRLVNETAASGHSRSAVTDLVTLIRQLYRFAYPRDMCTREHGNYIVMPYTSEELHHQDFTDAELKILWENRDDPVVRMLLIMCYSGFRIGEFATLQVVLDQDGRNGYFCGGIKTKAGKNRIVPVHSAIMPLLRQILDSNGQPVFFCGRSTRRFREFMKQTLIRLGIDTALDREPGRALPGETGAPPEKIGALTERTGDVPENNGGAPGNNEVAPRIAGTLPGKIGVLPRSNMVVPGINRPLANSPPISGIFRELQGEYRYHTPHSCRHTFSRLCESYGVSEADRKRMMGHSFGNDITNGVYGHRSVEELRAEIEKIKIPEM